MSAIGPAPEELGRLRRSLNDLIGIMALPTLWAGGGSKQVANILLDALFGMFSIVFAFVRLEDPPGGPVTELIRLAQSLDDVYHSGGDVEAKHYNRAAYHAQKALYGHSGFFLRLLNR